ncbi:unnamed protein product [Medioppia subpectinata]|uniref:G-protein coupled receptors family 1 profile domain-containing protein n=1 Tax=Medioppia subpectinata TaxID=1979941 RepID=A0A7R9Q395_9ACAR|nr:unnamed protein product [Medioppia subpectinata]CAG2111081.1 unnamed protein product [Medioppia subpectinata]
MIVLLFAICWLPIHVFSLLVWFYPQILKVQTKLGYRTFIWTYFVCHFMSMGHSFVNPIVYCFMSSNFRVNLCSVLNKYISRLKCRRSDYRFDGESESNTRSQFVSLYSTKYKRRTNNEKTDKQIDDKTDV